MADYTIVSADDAKDHYAGTDVPGEFRRLTDALGWALNRAGRPRAGLRWAHRALRLGSLDAGLRYHAGMTALAAGRRSEGRRNLRLALAHGLAAQPLHASRARKALR